MNTEYLDRLHLLAADSLLPTAFQTKTTKIYKYEFEPDHIFKTAET